MSHEIFYAQPCCRKGIRANRFRCFAVILPSELRLGRFFFFVSRSGRGREFGSTDGRTAALSDDRQNVRYRYDYRTSNRTSARSRYNVRYYPTMRYFCVTSAVCDNDLFDAKRTRWSCDRTTGNAPYPRAPGVVWIYRGRFLSGSRLGGALHEQGVSGVRRP